MVQLAHTDMTGLPLPPYNFTFNPDNTTATDIDVVVNMMWLPFPELGNNSAEPGIEYTVAITHASSSIVDHTSSSNFTATLQFNTNYSVTIYASRCNGTLTSDPLITNITIDKGI